MVEWKWGEGERGRRCKGREVSIGRFVLPAFLPAFAASTVQIPTIDFVLSFVQAAATGPSRAYSPSEFTSGSCASICLHARYPNKSAVASDATRLTYIE